MESFFQSKQNQILGSLVLAMVVIALATYAFSTWRVASDQYGPATVVVFGEGEVTAVPDIGQFSYTVTRQGADANEARAKAAEASVAILEYLKSAGVEEKDIKTESYNLYPKYRWEQQPCPMGSMYCPQGESIPDGFEVMETVRVKIRDLNRAGDLIGGVSERGATTVYELSFTIDDENQLKDQARSLAIADAKAKADALAKDLGVRIVNFVSYYEEDVTQPYYGYQTMDRMTALPEIAGANPEPQIGERTITSRVSVTYEVR